MEEQDFKTRLKRYRVSRNWSIPYIADTLRVPKVTWYQWESGRCEPPDYTQKGIFALMREHWKEFVQEVGE